MKYLRDNELPLHRLGQARWTPLEDEDIVQDIKLKLAERAKGRYMKASDVVDVVASPEFQAVLKQKGFSKTSISECMARCWLAGLGWQYGKTRNRMYVNGHECEDIMEY